MFKCFAIIVAFCLLVSNVTSDPGKRSNRLNMLSKAVNARMLAGNSGLMDQTQNDFTMNMNGGNNQQQFVPISRSSTPAISTMTQSPTTQTAVVDNTIGGQQLTPDQVQQLHQFVNQQQTFQPNNQQQQPQSFQSNQQPMQPMQQQQQQFQPSSTTVNKQVFRMDNTGNNGNNGNNGMMSFDQTAQQQQQQFQPQQQGRFVTPAVTSTPTTTTTTTSTTTTTPIMPVVGRMQGGGGGNNNNNFGNMGGFGVGGGLTQPQQPQQQVQQQQTSQQTSQQTDMQHQLQQQLLDQQILAQKLQEQLKQLLQQQQKIAVQAQQSTVAPQVLAQQQIQATVAQQQINQQQQMKQQQDKLQQKINDQQQQQQQITVQQNQLAQQQQSSQQRISAQQQLTMPAQKVPQQPVQSVVQTVQPTPVQTMQQQQPMMQTQMQQPQQMQMQPTPMQQQQQQMMTQQQQQFNNTRMPVVAPVVAVSQQPATQIQAPTMVSSSTIPQIPQIQQKQPTKPTFMQQQGAVSDNVCVASKAGDLLPHPTDPTQFIICYGFGEFTLMDCPDHTVFNTHMLRCDVSMDMPLLCKSNPCSNGASCTETSATQFQCTCAAGFSGPTCEKLDTCQTRPCGQDGVCLSFALGSPVAHVCLCNGGRSVGLTCDRAEQNPCLIAGSGTKLMSVGFNKAVFAHCEGSRPHFKFCQPPLEFSAAKQACEWS